MSTHSGLHKDCDLSEYPKEIRNSVYKISQHFYVTRTFKPERIGNSEYWAVLARPTDDFSIHLNADRELLVLFSRYQTFEIRTLEAYESFYALLEQKRVDKSIRFLVSCDSRIEQIIRHYLNQNPEYPIIIPLTLDELREEGGSLLAAIRRNYLLRDLFGYQNPLREETFFFGRQDVVSTVLDLAKSGQSSSIFGLRKSGKTSTTYAIQRKAKSFDCTSVLLDCQNPAVHARRFNELLSYVLDKIREALGVKRRPGIMSVDPVVVAESFELEVRQLLGQAKTNVLVVFDEIENITPGTAASPHWNDGRDALLFWQCIRSFVQAESKGKLAICIVGTSPLLLELPKLSGVANPMYLFSQKRFIPSFNFEETRNMIESLGFYMGLEFDPTQIAELQKRYGGHPFFIRQVASQVHQISSFSRPLKVSNSQLKSAMERFAATLDSYIADILGNLKDSYQAEFDLLGAIVRGERDEVEEYGRVAPDLIDHLFGYGIVEERDGKIEIRFGALESALKRIFIEDRPDYSAEISRRRNALEVAIRSSLFFWSKTVNHEIWSAVLEANLTKKRFEGLPTQEPALLFSAGSSPLYVSDLLMLLKDTDVLPYLGDNRSRVLAALDTVNKNRVDAHAKRISQQDYNSLCLAFEELESEFLPPE